MAGVWNRVWAVLAGAIFVAAPAAADVDPIIDWTILHPQNPQDAKTGDSIAAEYSRDSGERVRLVFSCMDPTSPPGHKYLRLIIVALKSSFYLHKETPGKIWSFYIIKFDDDPSVSHTQAISSYTNIDFLAFAPDSQPWDNNPKLAGEPGKQLIASFAASMAPDLTVVGSTGDLRQHRALYVELEFDNGNQTFGVNLNNPRLSKYVNDCAAK